MYALPGAGDANFTQTCASTHLPALVGSAASHERHDLCLCSLPNLRTVELKLAKADFHGAVLSSTVAASIALAAISDFIVAAVVRHANPLMVGITGIVLQESENVFRLIKQDDTLLSGCSVLDQLLETWAC